MKVPRHYRHHFTTCSIAAVLALTAGSALAESRRLTSVEDSYPWPSPDGRTIVFESDRTGVDQIYAIAADGTGLRRLTDFPGGAESPVFSPDGEWIAFAAYVDGEGQGNDVFIMRADGTEQTRLTREPGYDGHPHWTGDGERIIFNSDRATPDPDANWNERWHEIFSMRRDGTDVRQLTRCETVCTFGSLSPDGTKLAYRKVIDGAGFNWRLGRAERNSEVFVADADGGNPVNISRNAAFDGWPRWSPDGTQIVFASNRAGPASVGQLYIINADGTGLERITEGPWSYTQPAWAQDGSTVYAHQAEDRFGFETGGVAVIEVTP